MDNKIEENNSVETESANTTEATPTEDSAPTPVSTEPAPIPVSTEPASTPVSMEPAPTPVSTEPAPTPVSTDTAKLSVDEYEILTEQFENYLRIAQSIFKTLKRPRDIEIFTNMLHKVRSLNDSKQLTVKRNNNIFFRYCLKVLKWTSDNQPLQLYNYWYSNEKTETESRTWIDDNKSYMASKYLKDGSYIIYYAVAEEPSAGWQDGGLNILAKQGVCSRNK